MPEIRISKPLPMSSRLERLHLFAGRHLGEDEFDRLQDYTDARLEPLLTQVEPGIVRGLEVRLSRPPSPVDSGAVAGALIVTPGLAVAGNGQALGLFGPVRQTWRALIDAYLRDSGAVSAAGVFYLVLRRDTGRVDAADDVDPCQRSDLDPTRDSRRVVVGELALRRLSIDPGALTSPAGRRARVENWAAAAGADGELLRTMGNAVPLGLLAVSQSSEGYAVDWFSSAAGRYLSAPNSGYRVLLQQVSEAFSRALAAVAAPGETRDLETYLDAELKLDFMPAAGQLPLDLLRDRASMTPRLLWWPAHVAVDVVPVPEESVADLIERHLPRRVLDLRAPAGDHIRLLLAVNEPDYRRDLLDLPEIDRKLEADLYRYYMTAHDAWRVWKRQFDRLYHLPAASDLSPGQAEVLGLPDPVAPPERPEALVLGLVAQANAELAEPGSEAAPYPYDAFDANPPQAWARPPEYLAWLVPAGGGEGAQAPQDSPPQSNGLAVQYALAEMEIERLENEHRALQKRLEATRDYLLLQRQQLDVQTVSLAALAGGVAGDGSGLQLARWLPFTRFTSEGLNPEVIGTDVGAATTDFRKLAIDSGGSAPRTISSGTQTINILFGGQQTTEPVPTKAPVTEAGARVAEGFKLSNLDYLLKKDQLDSVGRAASEPVSPPVYEVDKKEKFGVIGRVLPDAKEYSQTYDNLIGLQRVVDDLFPGESEQLRAELDKAGQIKTPAKASNTTLRYQQMFKAGKVLIRQINIFEARHTRLELELRALDRELRLARARLQQLGDEITTARRMLDAINSRRIEELGDYGVAAKLIDEDWRKVNALFRERARILDQALRGLYYVRVRPTPVSAALTDPLPLRHGGANDIVPGCDGEEDVDVPAELVELFDAVLEIPLRDWRLLEPLAAELPMPERLDYLFALRQSRLGKRRTQAVTANAVEARLQPMLAQNQAVLQQMSKRPLPVLRGSIKTFYADAAEQLSLADVVNGSHGRLRRQAGELRERLEQCVVCSLRRLSVLPPSLRLQWAQLAEDDQIAVDEVQRWPGLEQAERQAFNTVRTLAELVQWWFRQLGDAASAGSISAARNMIRGILVLASLGDPNEILHGQVQVPPRRLLPGEALRIKLNRRARPGTALQLLDASQRPVATLNLVDADERGAIANIVKVEQVQMQVTTAFTVVSVRKRQADLKR